MKYDFFIVKDYYSIYYLGQLYLLFSTWIYKFVVCLNQNGIQPNDKGVCTEMLLLLLQRKQFFNIQSFRIDIHLSIFFIKIMLVQVYFLLVLPSSHLCYTLITIFFNNIYLTFDLRHLTSTQGMSRWQSKLTFSPSASDNEKTFVCSATVGAYTGQANFSPEIIRMFIVYIHNILCILIFIVYTYVYCCVYCLSRQRLYQGLLCVFIVLIYFIDLLYTFIYTWQAAFSPEIIRMFFVYSLYC